MSLRFSHTAFPSTPSDNEHQSLPWGLVLQPLAPLPPSSLLPPSVSSQSIERCAACYAYINPFVQLIRRGWKCSLCRATNSFTLPRYETIKNSSMERRKELAELTMQDVEVIWSDEEADRNGSAVDHEEEEQESEASRAEAEAIAAYRASQDPQSTSYDPTATLSQPYQPAASASLSPPAYLFLVDVSGDSGYVELVKSSLLAAIEALSPSVWVGLAVVSNRIGLYDLRCSIPTVSHCLIRSSAAASKYGPSLDVQSTSLPLQSIIGVDTFLQKLETCKENLCAAIESMTSQQTRMNLKEMEEEVERETMESQDYETGAAGEEASPNPNAASPKPTHKPTEHRTSPCGFGAALHALLNYLSAVSDAGFELNVRILSFLSQRPNWGLGALRDRTPTGRDAQGQPLELNEEDWDRFLQQPNEGGMATSGDGAKANDRVSSRNGAEFYRELGSACSQKGICIDLYAVSPAARAYMDLATLKSLTVLTGGNLVFYPSLSSSTLPQDLFRQLKLPQSFRCLLRFRTSPEFQLTNVYGHLVADREFENLFRVGGCDARKVFAADLDFAGSEGFSGGYADVLPALQVAFSYICVNFGSDGVERVEHRLRIMTRQMPLVRFQNSSQILNAETQLARETMRKQAFQCTLSELHSSAAPEIVLTLLLHQLIHASLERGIQEARNLLKDWITDFLIKYQQLYNTKLDAAVKKNAGKAEAGQSKEGRAPSPTPLTIDSLDLQLSATPNLQFLPRFIFALLKSPLLSSDPGSLSPDHRSYLHVLYSGLEPDFAVKCVYPTLSTFNMQWAPHMHGQPTHAIKELTLQQAAGLASLEMHHPVLFLSRSSIDQCGDHVFLLDSFTELILLHARTLSSQPYAHLCPLPPPAHSSIGKLLRKVKASTPYLTPRLLYADESQPMSSKSDEALRHFMQHLMEDEQGGEGGFSYATFIQQVGQEVLERLIEEQTE